MYPAHHFGCTPVPHKKFFVRRPAPLLTFFFIFARMLKKAWNFIWKTLLFCFLLSLAAVIVFRFVPLPFTFLMLERCVEQKMDGKEIKLEYNWVPLPAISNHLQLAVVCSEDQNFLIHHGFDFDAIQKAISYNEKQAKKRHPHVRGAIPYRSNAPKMLSCSRHAILSARGWKYILQALSNYFGTNNA